MEIDKEERSLFWLWVDPRSELGYHPNTFDQAAFLMRAMTLFRTKERWSGQSPTTLKAHPMVVENGLKPIADSLGLGLVSDPKVAPGTYQLGVATETMKGGYDETEGTER